MKIMIIEDEKNVREELRILLESSLYKVIIIEEFQEILEQIQVKEPDLILLDIHLPGMDGQKLCPIIRQKYDIPIIFVTSDDNVMTEVQSIQLGADDFIAKPYHPSVLLARISAVLKRSAKQKVKEMESLEYKGLQLNLRSYKISYQGKEQELSKNECKLLYYLMLHRGEFVSRLDLIEYLWDQEVFIDDNALSVNVTRLRGKIGELGILNYIETKRGAGYRI